MNENNSTENLFDINGQAIPLSESRVFRPKPVHTFENDSSNKSEVAEFYKICNRSFVFENAHKIGVKFGAKLKLDEFKKNAIAKLDEISQCNSFKNLVNGPKYPFLWPQKMITGDLGIALNEKLLPELKKIYEQRFEGSEFRQSTQDNVNLSGRLSISDSTGYSNLFNLSKSQDVVGWYFPQAFQGFDIDSQNQFFSLKVRHQNFCLSGVIEVAIVLMATPDMLRSEEYYAPILLTTGSKHVDERLITAFKAYGPHLEFWCMTQMLTPGVKQVSEQWTGGLTLF